MLLKHHQKQAAMPNTAFYIKLTQQAKATYGHRPHSLIESAQCRASRISLPLK